MDASFPDWNAEVRGDPHIPTQRKPLGSENDLVELLWQDGGVVLNTQINGRKQSKQPQDYEEIPWINESFEESNFYANILSQVPPQNPSEKQSTVAECSVRRINSSHCESNHVDMSWASSSYGVGAEMKYGQNVSSIYQSATDKESLGPDFTSCSGGSGSGGFCNQANERKRKGSDVEESECRSDATGLDSAAGNKSSQKPGTSRRRRVAEVHNMSERRRRDRINERMKALQELIPHSSKSDKASLLDEAIEYMKSLQWQLQMMWMGSGMGPMMVPSMQHHMSRFGMGMGPQMLRVDHMSMAARTNQALVSYQNQMQNYMGFHSVPNVLQPANIFPFGFHSTQQNTIVKPPGNSNGSMGSHAS